MSVAVTQQFKLQKLILFRDHIFLDKEKVPESSITNELRNLSNSLCYFLLTKPTFSYIPCPFTNLLPFFVLIIKTQAKSRNLINFVHKPCCNLLKINTSSFEIKFLFENFRTVYKVFLKFLLICMYT